MDETVTPPDDYGIEGEEEEGSQTRLTPPKNGEGPSGQTTIIPAEGQGKAGSTDTAASPPAGAQVPPNRGLNDDLKVSPLVVTEATTSSVRSLRYCLGSLVWIISKGKAVCRFTRETVEQDRLWQPLILSAFSLDTGSAL